MKKSFFVILLTCFATGAYAAHTANAVGKITWITIYNNNTIYFNLDPMPTDHGCAIDYFTLEPTLDSEARARYYSALLTARTTGNTISIGYDKVTPTCNLTRPIAEAFSY